MHIERALMESRQHGQPKNTMGIALFLQQSFVNLKKPKSINPIMLQKGRGCCKMGVDVWAEKSDILGKMECSNA
jgi:hypothetical protein